MSEELLARIIYSFSLTFHNFFASLTLGIAVVQWVYVFYHYFSGWENNTTTIRLTFDLLVLSIILSVLSGFALEIEFKRFWPVFDSSLQQWNHHIGHKSAIISYFLSSALIIATYYFRIWNKPHLYLLSSVLWLGLAWLFSMWGIFLNTVMQNPLDAVIEDGVLILSGSLAERFFSSYHLTRQVHIAAAAVLKGSIIVLLLWTYCNRILLRTNFRIITAIVFAALICIGITGHFQALNISHYQPSKFAAMEGILAPSDTLGWNVLGFMSPDRSITSISLKGGLQKMTNAPLKSLQQIPAEEQPPVPLVFNAFRIMVYSFLIILIALLYFWLKRKEITVPALIFIVVIIELAINSGWIVSESGRQPWTFYGLMKREYLPGLRHINLSLAGVVANSFLIVAATFLGIFYLKKQYRLHT